MRPGQRQFASPEDGGESRLRGRRHLIHVGQKDTPTPRPRQGALRGHTLSVSPAPVTAEEVLKDQVRRVRAVHTHERTVGTVPPGMNRRRDSPLIEARLRQDQHTAGGRNRAPDRSRRLPDCG